VRTRLSSIAGKLVWALVPRSSDLLAMRLMPLIVDTSSEHAYQHRHA
jgi:hypothetical protein